MLTLALLLLLADSPADVADITAANVIVQMNVYRAAEGLPLLREDPRLSKAAEDRMRHMEELAYWSHTAPDGMSPFVWLAARDYVHAFAGENLATGFETTPVLVESWMESKGHRDNILSRNYEEVGVAIIDGATRGPAAGKSIVVLFGSTRHQVTASKR